MIKLDLYLMGFNKLMVDELLKNELVEDTNQAVDLLIKGPNGWNHKFVSRENSENCKICQEPVELHVNERQRIEELRGHV
jgi:hypothetical protein